MQDLLHWYERMLLIRAMEQWVIDQYQEQNTLYKRKEIPLHTIKCPTHLSIGQEAAAVGVCAALTPEDIIFSTHRCHAHYLAKGGDPYRMAAELLGRVTGCAQGKGGSMHLVDPLVGMMGSSAIVGGSIPLAAGAALSFKLRGIPKVAVAFFGDGAIEEGVFHETMHIAGQWRLPMIFACENNFYATLSHLSSRQHTSIAGRAESYGMPGVTLDGNDVQAVYLAAQEAVTRARRGEGPTLLVSDTYRWYAHVGHEPDTGNMQRTAEELATWKERCPIKRARETLQITHSSSDLDGLVHRVDEQVQGAVAQAKNDPVPEGQALYEYV